MYTIEKDVPKPVSLTETFRQMEVDDSTLVPLDGREAKNVSSSIHSTARASGMKFITRSAFTDDGDPAIRVWKVQ